MPKSYKMRYYCQVSVDLNKYKQKHYRLISTVGWCMKKGLTLGKTKNNSSTFSEVCQVYS